MADARSDTGRCGPRVLYARAMRCRLAPPPSAIARCGLLVLSVALLVAAGRLIDIGNVSADGHETDEQTLVETQIVADIPSGYGELFPLEWGGGSLYHLKGRLATMGCLVNTIWFYDEGEWQAYNQYEVPSTLTREFVDRYAKFVPAGTLYATCFRLCEFTYFGERQRDCETLVETLYFLRSDSTVLWNVRDAILDSTLACTHDVTPQIAQYVLPSLPVLPDACAIYHHRGDSYCGGIGPRQVVLGGRAMSPFAWFSGQITLPVRPPFVLEWYCGDRTLEDNRLYRMINEVHEWCHVNQYWHIAQDVQPDRVLREYPSDLWYDTPAGIDFLALTGFSRDEDGEWTLPEGHAFQDWWYRPNPMELAAEFCAFFFLHQARSMSGFPDAQWPQVHKQLVQAVQTAEIVRWLETHVVLPEIGE